MNTRRTPLDTLAYVMVAVWALALVWLIALAGAWVG